MPRTADTPEAVVAGRVSIDLYPAQLATPLRDVQSFRRFVGGFAGNVATGLARLGVRTLVLSRVGDEGNGEFIRSWLASEGVDVRYLRTDPYWLTPPVFCELWPPDHFPITFYRRPSAPDWQLSLEDFDLTEVSEAPLLIASGTGLAQAPSRDTTLAILRAHRGTTIFDLDWRPTLWDNAADYPRYVADAVRAADIVIGNEEECEAACLPDVPTLILKRGERGATIFEGGRAIDVPAFSVDVVNGLGAGDAFAAAVGQALLRGVSLVEAVRRGTVAGALVAAELACSAAMPRLDRLEAALT